MSAVVDGGWEDLVRLAVLGTSRLAGRPGERTEGGREPGLAALLGAVAAERSAERAVLATAAALSVARRAATPVAVGQELSDPAPVLDGVPAPLSLRRAAPTLLQDRLRPVLVEVAARCATTGVRFPASALPELLDLASARGPFADLLRPHVAGAAGARGRWLGARNPAWSWLLAPDAMPDDLDGAWGRGTVEERRSLLRVVRRADPARATNLLLRTWRDDRGPERAALVDELQVGLSMADEPFLEETARTDRAREVRQIAHRLLDRLPASRRAGRMAARALDLFERLDDPSVQPVPEDWVADGVVVPPTDVRSLLERVVASTPLDALGPPGPLVSRLRSVVPAPHDALLAALGTAAVSQARWDWAAGLLEAAPRAAATAQLARRVPPSVSAPWLAGLLARAGRSEAPALVALADGIPGPWPAGLVAELLRRHVDELTSGRFVRPEELDRCRLVGLRADPATLARLVPDLEAVRRADPRLERAFREAHSLAALRLDLLGGIDAAVRRSG